MFLYLDAGIRNSFCMAIQFSIKRSLSRYNPGELRRFWCMKQVEARWYLEIALHSALSQHPLPCDSLLSATKATLLSCGINCICRVVRTDIIQHHCSDGQDSWLAQRISRISRTQEKTQTPWKCTNHHLIPTWTCIQFVTHLGAQRVYKK